MGWSRMGRGAVSVLLFVLGGAFVQLHAAPESGQTPARWSEAKAQQWYAAQPWLVGANFVPADAINQLEMWQADSFNPEEIDRELGWAEGLGMNTMRVFLHDQLWQQDAPGFRKRIDTFLAIAAKHHIKPMLVLFDSCWDPDSKLGPQHPPIPGVHNSGWVQGPGAKALEDAAEYPRLKCIVQGVVGAFANDDRILAWDVWNEPDNEGRRQLREARAEEQGGAGGEAAAAGLCVGARGASGAAADLGALERRALGRGGQPERCRAHAD